MVLAETLHFDTPFGLENVEVKIVLDFGQVRYQSTGNPSLPGKLFVLISFVVIVENLDIVMVGIFHYFSQPLLQDHDTSFQKVRTAPVPVGTGYSPLRLLTVQTGQATQEKSNAASWRPDVGSPSPGPGFGSPLLLIRVKTARTLF